MLVGDADVVVGPGFGEVEEGGEFCDEVDSRCLVRVLADENALLALLVLKGVVSWCCWSDGWTTLIAGCTECWLESRMIG